MSKKSRMESDTPRLRTRVTPVPDKDAAVLCEMIRINRDATAFYRTFGGGMEDAEAQGVLDMLTSIHEMAADRLSLLLRGFLETANLPELMEEADCDTLQFFAPLACDIPYGVTRQMASRLSMAEENCIHAMEQALDRDILPGTQEALIEQLDILSRAMDHVAQFRNLADKSRER